MVREYGEGSPIVEARVYGRYPDTGEDALYSRSGIERAQAVYRAADWSGPVTVALDVARFGPDRTALAVRQGPGIRHLIGWRGLDIIETCDQFESELERLGFDGPDAVASVVVDVVGLGAGAADELKRRGWRVREFNGGSRASEAGRFANRRAESYWRLRDLLAERAVALPLDEELAEELLATSWGPTADGKIALPPKESIKAELGRSPDLADVVTMAFAFDRQRVKPVAAVGIPRVSPWSVDSEIGTGASWHAALDIYHQ
jgi:hypothetical protein